MFKKLFFLYSLACAMGVILLLTGTGVDVKRIDSWDIPWDEDISVQKPAPAASIQTPDNNSKPVRQEGIYSSATDHCFKKLKSGECTQLVPCNGAMERSNGPPTRGFAILYNPGANHFNASSVMRTPGSPGSGADCAISQKYGFFFIHNLKSGGTTTKRFLMDALCPRHDADPQKPEMFECSAGPEVLKLVGCLKGIKTAKDQNFLIFSFVRDPYARLYSGYAMAEAYAKRKPYKYPPFSFREFALGSSTQRKRLSSLDISHHFPQSNYVLDRFRCPVFDYVGRLETYDEDLLRIIHEIEYRHHAKNNKNGYAMEDVPPTPLMEHYLKSKAQSQGRLYANEGTSFGKAREARLESNSTAIGSLYDVYADKQIVNHVATEYAVDFQSFGYSIDHIPGNSPA